MKSEDKKRVFINHAGGTDKLYSPSGLLLSDGYERVVFGGRGPYVEIGAKHIVNKNIHIPSDQLYRLSDLRIYYVEFRSNCDSNVKIYYQLKTVSYADYRLTVFYISPKDLRRIDGTRVMKNDTNEYSVDFFE